MPLPLVNNDPSQDQSLPVATGVDATGLPLRRVYIGPDPTLPDVGDAPVGDGGQFSAGNPTLNNVLDKLLGTNGQDRYQLWPEKLIRDALAAPHDAMNTTTPVTSQDLIKPALDVSAMAGTGGLAGAGEDAGAATLGAGPFLRPALKYEGKIYKAPMGGQHMDAIPADLQPEFTRQAMSGEDISNFNFGFMNHKGQFLDREKALQYAVKEGLIDPRDAKYGALTSTLMADSGKEASAIDAISKQPFYSAAEKAVNDIPQAKMTGDQWLGTLANKPGVKSEELQYTGLNDFLKSKGGSSVTKEEVQGHLQNNKVELGEVDKGGDAQTNPKDYYENTIRNNNDPTWDQLNQRERAHWALEADGAKAGNTKYHDYQLPGGPLSRDTEILTDKGWKRIDVVKVGDVVITRKDDTGVLEWQPVEATPKVYAENLYHFYSQSIDMRVTENHQMIAKKRRRSCASLIRLTAKELWATSEMLVPLTGVWEGEGDDKIFGFDANDLAELFGWYLAEGSYKRHKDTKNTIQIAQCREYNPEKCARIEALLDRMGLSWRYYGGAYGIHIKNMDRDLKELLHEQPTSEFKFVPYFFFKQSTSVIKSLLDGLILGDGCTSEQEGRLDKTSFFTKSEQLAGDVQILILMTGKNANVRQRPSGLYVVGIKSKEWSSVDEAKFEIAPYNDFAFCVTVQNHAIYVRRSGVAAFTGNSNYREKLLTLPPNKIKLEQHKVIRPDGHIDSTYNNADGAANRAREIGGTVRQAETLDLNSGYKSSHWDEPNIIAHTRMNDRMIDDKKSLHIEEIQSDWHQQGRDKGYKDPKAQERYDAAYKAVEDARTELRKPENWEKDHNKILDPLLEEKRLASEANTNTIPDAPFKKTWHELALKRMIREAAEKGYDRLSWTPGEAQAARYDLSKSIEKLSYNPKQQYIKAWDKNGKEVIAKDSVKPEDLPGIVGKEAADKLLKQEPKNFDKLSNVERKNLKVEETEHQYVVKNSDGRTVSPGKGTVGSKEEALDYAERYFNNSAKEINNKRELEYGRLGPTHILKGQDLKIGGEGMKGFYDKIIPKALEKISGEKVKHGLVEGNHDASLNEPFESRDKAIDVLNRGGEIYAVSRNSEELIRTVKELKEAENELGKPFSQFILGDRQPKQPVHYIDMTPALRAKALKGFPLFSSTHFAPAVEAYSNNKNGK